MVTATDSGTPGQETAFASSSWTFVENTPPVITEGVSTSTSMDEDDSPSPFGLTLHASDADNDTISWDIASPASHGTATTSGTGAEKTIGYTPDANFNGSNSFQIQVADGKGGTDTITVTVTVNPRNHRPVNTLAPSFTGTPHVGKTLTAVNGDWNDNTDLLPGTLSYTYQWQRADDASGANSADISGATAITYTAVLADNGNYLSVKVTATDDGEGLPASQSTTAASSWQLVTNVAPIITEGAGPLPVSISEDSSPTPFSLTLHATDADNDTLSWEISSPALHGTATASGTGNEKVIGYTPNTDYNGFDSFTVRSSDGLGGTDTIQVIVTVNAVNDKPVNTAAPTVSGTHAVGRAHRRSRYLER